MSQYKPYPAYKDSGVEWLGRVPEHWDVLSFQRCVAIAEGQVDPEQLPYSEMMLIAPNHIEPGSGRMLYSETAAEQNAESGKYLCQAGDVVYSKIRPALKKVCIATEVGLCSADMYPMHGHSGMSNGFLFWFLLSEPFSAFAVLEADRVAMPKINRESLNAVQLPRPPLAEQRVIASRLDRETARIDGLVEKKTRFIELLREKRQALITHAVTKGLDPNVKMKDSGVEWLGEVPEHWVVCKLSFRYSVELGKMLDEKKLTKTSLVPYLRNQDVQWGAINIQNLPEMDIHPAELERYTVMDGDLMVCEGGDVGRAAIWRGESSVFGYQKALHRLRPRSQNTDTAEFFFFSLLAAKKRGVFEESDSKATIAHLPAEKFRQYRFAFPPKLEQREIADHVRIESESLDVLLTKTERSIELLKERRSALITAAVTGQIDLREAI